MRQGARQAAPRIAWLSQDGASVLYQGDAFAFMAEMEEESIDCIWTDPPYFLSNGGITCVAGRRVPVDKGSWDESRGIEEDHEFHLAWLRACHRLLKPAGTLWVSGTLHGYLSVGMAMLRTGFRLLNDIVWEKPNPPPNLGCRCFTHATEILLWATKAQKGSRHRHTFHYAEMKRENGGRQMRNVWRLAPPGPEEKRHGKHPTQKPVALIERCLRASTDPGDLVFDPFAGSGSTGVASLALGRRFTGCELRARYVRIACARLREADAARPAPAASASA